MQQRKRLPTNNDLELGTSSGNFAQRHRASHITRERSLLGLKLLERVFDRLDIRHLLALGTSARCPKSSHKELLFHDASERAQKERLPVKTKERQEVQDGDAAPLPRGHLYIGSDLSPHGARHACLKPASITYYSVCQ